MWFKILALILGTTLILKSVVGIVFHEKFYSWDKDQYSEKRAPITVLLFLTYGIVVVVTTVYATIFHYVSYGWVITAVSFLMAIKIYQISYNWKKFSASAKEFIVKAPVNTWLLDIITFITGVLILTFAFTLYA